VPQTGPGAAHAPRFRHRPIMRRQCKLMRDGRPFVMTYLLISCTISHPKATGLMRGGKAPVLLAPPPPPPTHPPPPPGMAGRSIPV
jgi:hypothetical protein